MVEYPSNAIEISRDVLNTRKEFPSLYILSDLSKRGLSLKKKLSLIQGYNLKEKNLLDVVLQTKKEFIKGERCLTEDQLRLGVGPDGRYRHEEFLVGMVLEKIIDKKMYRYTENNDFDFISSEMETYDVIGPVPPYYFNSKDFITSYEEHLKKQGLDYIVACTITMPDSFQEDFRILVEESTTPNSPSTIIIDEEILPTWS